MACITGTAAWEAAVMGIPVISFSQNNCYNFLNHVFYIDTPYSLNKIISHIDKTETPNKSTIKSGSKLYQAYFKSSFDLGDIKEFDDNWNKLDENKAKIYSEILYIELVKKFLFVNLISHQIYSLHTNPNLFQIYF